MADLLEEAATTLAVKDAELAEVWQQYIDANEARIDAEAQLAEARKALADLCDWIEHEVGAELPFDARRVLEGGESDE